VSTGDDGRTRPFADVLREMSRGRSHDELSVALRRLVEAVEDTGKKGTLTYTITVTRMKDGLTLNVGDAISLKLPEHDRPVSIFWADREHNLTRSDPQQPELWGSHVMPAPVPEGVDPDTGEIKENYS